MLIKFIRTIKVAPTAIKFFCRFYLFKIVGKNVIFLRLLVNLNRLNFIGMFGFVSPAPCS